MYARGEKPQLLQRIPSDPKGRKRGSSLGRPRALTVPAPEVLARRDLQDPGRSPLLPGAMRQVSVFAALKRLPSPVPKVENLAPVDVPQGAAPLPHPALSEEPIQSQEAAAKLDEDEDELTTGEATPKAPTPSPKGERTRRVSFAKDTKTPKPTSLKELLSRADSE
ncbi:unnamed protein product [Durusdinium trenchii]|uniref:Uncharacterized protein n=1 Tax=Durusdinium trenchii TaxID=1381693 RepID=A0ABP0L0H4_9DINO